MTDLAQIAARTRVALLEAEVARLAAENARMREVLATRARALGIPENLVGPSIDSIVRGAMRPPHHATGRDRC